MRFTSGPAARAAALLIGLATAGALAAAPAPAGAAARLTEIMTPSDYVDASTVPFNGAGHVKELRAKVLLPDGYDPGTPRPVLFLLSGAGGAYTDWADPAHGDIMRLAEGFPGIIVMPEAATGFYMDWWNGGRRGQPSWTRFYLDELIGEVERQLAIAQGRQNHAIAGLSMGGFGALMLASQRPDYFGSAASFSGVLNIQRVDFASLQKIITRVDYEAIFGPRDGFYAAGHNPTAIIANLASTRLLVTTGDGTPSAAHLAGADALSGGAELDVRLQNDDFVAAAKAAGIPVDYRPRAGQHQWPYFREGLSDALASDLFAGTVTQMPDTWSYSTARQDGQAWDFHFALSKAPTAVVHFSYAAGALSGSGGAAGSEATITGRDGCSVTVRVPFGGLAAPGPCSASGHLAIRVTASPRRLRLGRATTVRFAATLRLPSGARAPVAGALVRFAGHGRRTDGQGVARLRVTLRGRPGSRRASISRRGLTPATLVLTAQRVPARR